MITATHANDVFVVGAKSAGFEIGPTDDGAGFVVWKGDSVDILFGFEKIRFTDMTVNLSKMKGPVYQDSPTIIQHLEGKTSSDTFVVSGPSSAYAWEPTKDGTGVVIWTEVGSDKTYDVLQGFETVKFNDTTLDLKTVGVTIHGTRKSDKIDETHSPKGQPNPTAGGDKIIGGGNNDKMKGLGGNDTILGGKGNDKAFGGADNDLLSGGPGRNKLIGGSGADSFLFNSKLNKSFSKVMDFDRAEGDKVLLANSVFHGKGLKDGDLSAEDFNNHFDYTKHGILKYDGETIAKFKGAPDLHFDDFLLI